MQAIAIGPQPVALEGDRIPLPDRFLGEVLMRGHSRRLVIAAQLDLGPERLGLLLSRPDRFLKAPDLRGSGVLDCPVQGPLIFGSLLCSLKALPAFAFLASRLRGPAFGTNFTLQNVRPPLGLAVLPDRRGMLGGDGDLGVKDVVAVLALDPPVEVLLTNPEVRAVTTRAGDTDVTRHDPLDFPSIEIVNLAGISSFSNIQKPASPAPLPWPGAGPHHVTCWTRPPYPVCDHHDCI